MSNDLNRTLLIGRLTSDPELKHTNSGTAYCKFSIAVNNSYTSNGEKKEEVSYINCITWSKGAEILNQYAKKGKQLSIDGKMKQNRYEDGEGKKRSNIEITVDSFQLLGGKSEPTENEFHNTNGQPNIDDLGTPSPGIITPEILSPIPPGKDDVPF